MTPVTIATRGLEIRQGIFSFSYDTTAGPVYFLVPLLAEDFCYYRKNTSEWISLPSYFGGENIGGATGT